MTQIELRSCPFCGEAADIHYGNSSAGDVWCSNGDCPLHEMLACTVDEWNTRSDTREQAAASPSAVGEQVTDADLARQVLDVRDGHFTRFKQPWHVLTAAAKALSSQAPKPASAACYDLLVEARGWITKPASGHDEGMMYVDFIERLDGAISAKPTNAGGEWKDLAKGFCAHARHDDSCPSAHGEWGCDCGLQKFIDSYSVAISEPSIAAEADTANDEPTTGFAPDIAEIISQGWDELFDTSTPNRLAPIEARGAVTDEYAIAADAVCKARNEWSEKHEERWLETDENHPDDFIGRAVVDALRARESAPAVEPSVATDCAGEVTEAMVDAAIDAYYESTDYIPRHEGMQAALEAALSQPTRAAGES